VVHFADMSDEERIRRLERKVVGIRKMLFGALLLAKDMWGDELSGSPEGLGIMEAMEKAEESFAGGPPPERFGRFEHAIDVIDQRSKSIFGLMSYMSKYGNHK
jgi:hypothetical protein